MRASLPRLLLLIFVSLSGCDQGIGDKSLINTRDGTRPNDIRDLVPKNPALGTETGNSGPGPNKLIQNVILSQGSEPISSGDILKEIRDLGCETKLYSEMSPASSDENLVEVLTELVATQDSNSFVLKREWGLFLHLASLDEADIGGDENEPSLSLEEGFKLFCRASVFVEGDLIESRDSPVAEMYPVTDLALDASSEGPDAVGGGKLGAGKFDGATKSGVVR